MNRILLILLSLMFVYPVLGQYTLERTVVGSAGKSNSSVSTYTMEYTIGEVAVEEASQGTYNLNQGFQQLIEAERGRTFDLKVFLEGAYSGGGTMTTTLNTEGTLPLSQPFNTAPWNYAGSETVLSIPANITDWVLVTVRTDVSSATVVATVTGLLRNDGQILGIDGGDLEFENDLTGENSLHITVYHRNHLAVITPGSVIQVNDVFTYDFTQNPAFGVEAITLLPDGNNALIAGDANSDGVVNAADRSITWNSRNQSGYLQSDCNLNNTTDAADRSITWNKRNNSSKVP